MRLLTDNVGFYFNPVISIRTLDREKDVYPIDDEIRLMVIRKYMVIGAPFDQEQVCIVDPKLGNHMRLLMKIALTSPIRILEMG
jgi:hypothetical protein